MKLLFLCTTEFQLMTALNIKYHIYPQEDADIIVANYHNCEKELADRIRHTKLFHNVFYVSSAIENRTLHQYCRCITDGEQRFDFSEAIKNTWIFLKAKYLGKLFGPKIYIKNMVTNFSELRLTEYDELLTYGTKPITSRLIECIIQHNKHCRINMLDEGMGIYSDPNILDIDLIDTCYVYEPEVVMYKKNFCKVPKIDKAERKFIEILKYVFEFKEEDTEDLRDSVIFCDQGVSNKIPAYLKTKNPLLKILFHNAYKRHLKEEKEFYEQTQIINIILNVNPSRKIWIKLHPRASKDVIDEYRKRGFNLIKRFDLPWEFLALNCFLKNNILVTNDSSSVCLYKGVVDDTEDEIKCILLAKLNRGTVFFPGKEIVFQYFDKLEKKYSEFYVPETEEELAAIFRK